MRIIARNSPIEPEHIANAKIIAKDFSVILARESRIALLHFAQQTFLSRKHRPETIHINASALKHNAALAVHRFPRM